VLIVRRSVFAAALVASLSLVFAGSSQAQAPAGAPATQRATVVVIDVGAVFKEHIRFNQSMELMKKDVADFEKYVLDKRNSLTTMAEQLKGFNAGTPNYRDLETKMAKLTSDLQVEMQLKRRSFMEQEAQLYYTVYTEVKGEVARFANENGISLVLSYKSDEIDPADRASVLQGVNNPIVFQRNLDITQLVVGRVNEGSFTVGGNQNAARPQIPQRPLPR
jgi:Skp family chaperone for outer membrane proteins